ncbi:tyrosine-type recombinase/integrase [Microbacterium sp. A1-JK]|uniref:tyrosine-type recombinase/integrase n=1 Tax=Microbacterium sp. A1-JK TaxID=3177516 RepID=UPI0038847DCE
MQHRTLARPIVALTETDAAITTFLARYSSDSRRTYRAIIDRFREWHPGDILHATRAELELYTHYLLEDQGLKKSTVYGYLSGLSVFYRVAVADGRIPQDPTVMVRRPKVFYDDNRLTRLTSHDVEKLLLQAQERSPQHTALVALLGMLGLRCSEAVGVQIEDFAGYERGHRVLHLVGKGGKPATIPLPPMVFRILDRAVGYRTSGPLLTTRTGRQMTRHDAYRRIEVLGRHAGLGHVHPHQLRHAAATSALDAGVSTRDVQAFGRWSDARMVDRYDRNRHSLDRHAAYALASHMSAIADKIA